MNKKVLLLKNTVMLYIVTFSSYFFNFITIPYQTRVLGPAVYGELGFAQAFAAYFQITLDFGFLLSATAEVSRHRDDRKALSRIMSAILLCKLALGAICFLAAAGLCLSVPRLHGDVVLYLLYFFYVMINSLLPDYLYRGLENMSVITYRTVAVRLFFTVMVFLTLKSSEQYYVIPCLNMLGAIGACVWVYYDIYHRLGLRFTRVSGQYFFYTLKTSSSYFLSRVATSLYGATNTFILGFLYPAGTTVGLYSAAEKLMSSARSALSPISDSIYPYMVKNRDFKLIKKLLLFLVPPIAAGCVLVGVFAEPFCAILLGEAYRGAGPLLRLLLPLVVIALPTYLCGFPVLTSLGLEKYANLSVILASVIHIIQLLLLFVAGRLTVETVCIATCVTEVFVLGIRLFVIVSHKKQRQARRESSDGKGAGEA